MDKHLNIMDKHQTKKNMQVSLWINIKQRNSTKYVGVIMDKH